jgi:hypothetical protein
MGQLDEYGRDNRVVDRGYPGNVLEPFAKTKEHVAVIGLPFLVSLT